MLKKFVSLLFVFVILSTIPVLASEPKETVLVKNAFAVKIDGSYITSNAHYDYETDVIYLPLRAVFETLGLKVEWNNETRAVNITSNSEKSTEYLTEYKPSQFNYYNATVYPDSVIIHFDGKPVSASTFIFEDRTYISVEDTEAYTGHIFADNATKTLRIYSENYKELDDKTAVVYGDNKTLSYTQFFDLARFMYGDFSKAKEQGFYEIDNYLLFNGAVKKISDELGFSITEEEKKAFCEANNVEETIATRKIEDKEFFNNEVINDYVLREKIVSSDKKELYNPTDDELKNWYSNLAESKGIWLQAQHILISKDESGEGLKKAEKLLTEVKKDGADFTAIMLENSEDPGSKQTPEGYIFTQGQMVESFYNGALNLKVGEISGIVESEYGYHIIKKINHWESGIPFENLKDEVKASYNDKLFGEKLYSYAIEDDVFYIRENIISKYNETETKEN